MPRTFIAEYKGHCPDCDDAIEPGQSVLYVQRVLIHGDCLMAAKRSEKIQAVCKQCWLVQPCDCE